MYIKPILVVMIVIILFTTMLGGVRASSTTSEKLPMPYGSRDLTYISNPKDAPADNERFFGVRLNNDQWYTFVHQQDSGDYYLNSEYAASDINHNGIYGIEGDGNGGGYKDLEDINYYNFAKGGMSYPQIIMGANGGVENHYYGVTGVLGVRIGSYSDDPNKEPYLGIDISTLYTDNYIYGVTNQDIHNAKGNLSSSDSITTNNFLYAIIYVEKINAKNTDVSWVSIDNNSNPGVNAYPGYKVIEEKPKGHVAEKIFADEIKYLFHTMVSKATYGIYDMVWIAMDDIDYYKPYPYFANSGVGSENKAYYYWAATGGDVVQSMTFNSLNWYIPSSTNNKTNIVGLKIWAEFWYYEATNAYGGDIYQQKSFTTQPIYIYVVPKGLGVGIPIQPLPAGYGGSGYDNTSNVYIDPPSTFTGVINTDYKLKTVDLAYGFNTDIGLKDRTIQYDFQYNDSYGVHDYYTTANNGEIAVFTHKWTSVGNYKVKVRARAYFDGSWHPWSSWSKSITIKVVDKFKSGPDAPYAGSTTFYTDSTGKATITFTTSASTYSKCNIKYVFYWGDGNSTTTGWYTSGASVEATHSFSIGTYDVKVEAIAETGINSTSSVTKITVENSSSNNGGGGGGSGGSCVDPYTPILMADYTYKYAKDIEIGDKVITYNFTTGEYEVGVVENITITHEDREYIINGMLGVAKDQEVWTSRGWVEAQNLTTNDWIYNAYTGKWMQVYSIDVIEENIDMYDFHISNNQNYVAWMYILEDWDGIHAC